MIRTHSHKQLPLSEFDWPFQVALDGNNRWVKMSQCIPWEKGIIRAYPKGKAAQQKMPV